MVGKQHHVAQILPHAVVIWFAYEEPTQSFLAHVGFDGGRVSSLGGKIAMSPWTAVGETLQFLLMVAGGIVVVMSLRMLLFPKRTSSHEADDGP